jgi:hypothetical protein
VVLSIPVDIAFLNGPNRLHLALLNPHDWPIRLRLQAFDAGGEVLGEHFRDLPARTTQWADVTGEIYAPILALHPRARLAMRIESDPVRMEFSPTLYFFLHNLNTDIWSANHL